VSDPAASPPNSLPERPSLEHLRNQARRRLHGLREATPGAKLTEAQHQLARDYGFTSWPALKDHVEARERTVGAARYANLIGYYRHDPQIMTNAVASISAPRGRLMLRAVNGSEFILSERDGGRFELAGTPGWFRFEGSEDSPATALISHGETIVSRLERIDASSAQAMIEARKRAEEDQARPRKAIELDPARLERLTGHYMLPTGPALEVTVRGERLFAQVSGQPGVEIFPETETDFFYRILPAQLSFEVHGDRAMVVVLHQNGLAQRMARATAEEAEQVSTAIRNRLSEQQQPRTRIEVSAEALARCTGRYRLDAERVLIATAEGRHFFIEITGQPRLEVYPESETRFFWTVVAAQISFALDPREPRAIHAVLHQNGRDFPLPRIDDDGGPDA
jgi:hypothetical protein